MRDFTTAGSKVNDADGTPIMSATVVGWQVTDTARAVFRADDFIDHVRIPADSAVCQLTVLGPLAQTV